MSALLPSSGLQPVTDRYQFQLVTNCNQLNYLRPFLCVGFVTIELLSGCRPSTPAQVAAPKEIHTTSYHLTVPQDHKALLILFPCFSCDGADTRAESKIPAEAAANGIAVMTMDINHRIILSDEEVNGLIDSIDSAVKAHRLDARNTFIGGFSSGGNVSMLLAKALLKSQEPPVKLKGAFVVDSPIDLQHLYTAAQRQLERRNTPDYRAEPEWVVAFLDSALGDPTTHMDAYEARSPLLNSERNLTALKELPIRFYTEPDTAWWRTNRGDTYEEMNASALERIHATLRRMGNDQAEFITTEGRGIQHGNRHPHAWSIVDEAELVQWMERLSEPQ